jgi:hypothetical protein
MNWHRRHSAVAAILLSLFLTAMVSTRGTAQGSIDRQLIGEWLANVPGSPIQAVFRIEASGQCGLEDDVGTCQTQGGVLVFRSASSGENRYSYKLQGGNLTLSGGDLPQPLVFRRIGEAPPDSGTTTTANPASSIPESAEPTQTPAAPDGGLAGPGSAETSQPTASAKPARPKRALTEAEVVQLLEGAVPSRRVMDLAEERGIAFSVTPAVATKLKAKGASNELIAALRKSGGASAAGAPSPASEKTSRGLAALGNLGVDQVSGASQPQPSQRALASVSAPPLRGQRYSKENWGLNLVIPEAWKVGERGGVLLAGSDTEAGLMVIRFLPKAGLGELQQLYAQGIQEADFQAFPASPAEEFRAGSLRGIAGEMSGQSAQAGGMVRVRAIGIPSQFGSAVIVLGLTTEANYPNLKRRTDELAATISFSERKVPPVVDYLAGKYWRYSGSSTYSGSYSSEASFTLCDDGSFRKGGETYSSGQAGIAAGQSGNAGRWTADGDENQGVTILTYANGQSERLEYVVSQDPKDRSGYGPGVSFGGRLYQRTGGGSCGP